MELRFWYVRHISYRVSRIEHPCSLNVRQSQRVSSITPTPLIAWPVCSRLLGLLPLVLLLTRFDRLSEYLLGYSCM